MKRIFTLLCTTLCLLSLLSCGSKIDPPAAAGSSAGASSADSSLIPDPVPEPTDAERAAEIVAGMSLKEKVGQLFFVRCPQENAEQDVVDFQLGGYLLFGRDTKDQTAQQLTDTIATYQKQANIPLLIGVDEEGGTVVRVSSNPNLRSSKFQSPQALLDANGLEGLVWDTQEKDTLLASLGFNVNLAPVCDVSTDPSDFMYDRSMGLDGEGTADCVRAIVTQMREDGMGSVLKHFPGYGNNLDTHTGIAVDNRSLESFETSDFLPFSAGIDAGEDFTSVLVSHNIMTAVDSSLPASLSPAVHALLRQNLGFDGVVMTDDLAMEAVQSYAENGQVAVLALEAGNDLLITTDYRTQIPNVLEAVESGTLEESIVDTACVRVLCWKMSLGLL